MKTEDEILISAYLDGELAGDERQRVDQLLAASAEARQLADELRAVRTRLQELPRHRLPADFAEQTLRRAEQELAAARAVGTAVGSSDGSSSAYRGQTSGSAQPSIPSVWTTWRGFTWAAVALAAALMIWVTNRPPDDKPVAVAQGEKRPAEQQAPKIAAAEADRSNDALPTPMPTADLVASDSPQAPAPLDPAPAITQPDGARAARSFSATGAAPSPPVAVGRGLDAGAAQIELAPAGRPGLAAGQSFDIGGNGVLVVQLDITADAVQRGEFDRILAKHHIGDDDRPQDKKRDDELLRSPPDAAHPAAQESAADADQSRQATTDRKRDLDEWLPPTDAAGKLEIVYVEASPEQLAATLNDLVSANQWFSSVAVAQSAQSRSSNTAPKYTAQAEPPRTTPAPSPRPLDIPDDNAAAGELFTAKPAEKQTDRQQAAVAPREDSDLVSSRGHATRLALPADPTAAAGKVEAAPATPAKRLQSHRAIFVLRTVEPPTPAAR